MEKTKNTHTAVTVAKGLGTAYEKVIFRLSVSSAIRVALCFALSYAKIFASMTPFGVGFYASVLNTDSWIVYLLSSLAGIIASRGSAFWTYGTALVAITAIFAAFDGFGRVSHKAVVTGGVYGTLSLIRIFTGDFITYDIMAILLETAVMTASVIVFSYGYFLLGGLKRRSFISNKESLCAYIFISLVLLSLGEVPEILGFRIQSVASILLIYIMSMSAGGGAVTFGIIAGVIGALQSGISAELSATYAFGALLAVNLCKYGKTGVVLGFVISNTAMSLVMSSSQGVIVSVYDSLAAALIFAILPSSAIKVISMISSKTKPLPCDNPLRDEYSRNVTAQRLGKLSKTFGELSAIYAESTAERIPSASYTRSVMKSVEDKVCMGCKERHNCFGKSDTRAYRAMSSLMEAGKDGKTLGVVQLPAEFRERCHRTDSFVSAFNSARDILKTEKQWLGKINESRRLIADQLSGVADAMKREKKRCENRTDAVLTEHLWAELDKRGINAVNLIAEREENGDYNINVSFRDYDITANTKKNTESCITDVTGKEAMFFGVSRNGDETVFSFQPKLHYDASFGYASKTKNGEKVSGDSFGVIFTDDKKAVIALSDGMGSGESAAAQSRMTLDLLRKFLDAGFDCNTSVRMINSSLLLKSSREEFATLDICTIDLSGCTLTFTKLGAASAYICTKGGVTSVSASALPAGILRDVDIENHMLPIGSDTLVVLISDGVGDIALKHSECEGWIELELSKLLGANPQIVAGKLMEKACRLNGGKCNDDMTVIATYISGDKQQV